MYVYIWASIVAVCGSLRKRLNAQLLLAVERARAVSLTVFVRLTQVATLLNALFQHSGLLVCQLFGMLLVLAS